MQISELVLQQIDARTRLGVVTTFSEWFDSRRLKLLRLATNLSGDLQTAQDLVQNVTIRAHGRWTELQTLEYPDAYLRRMVINEHLSWRRKWSRIIPAGHLVDLELPPSPDHAASVTDQQFLRAELDRLPQRQRTVLVLRYYEGLDDAEIADLLRTRPVTIRAYASRALARLRVELAEESPPSGPRPPSTPPTSLSPSPTARNTGAS